MKFDLAAVKNQGQRSRMEDCYYFDAKFNGRSEIFGGVYDGHGGDKVAKLAEKELHRRFAKKLAAGQKIPEAFRAAYEEISDEVCSAEISGGACAANFLIVDGRIYFANAGDVRLLIIGSATVEQLTIDHHPDLPTERARIEKFKGIIIDKRLILPFSALTLSRALGDWEFRSSGLIATPETGVYLIKSDDLGLIVASDGVFEQLTNQEAAGVVRSEKTAKNMANSLVKAALKSGSGDNVTALVVRFIK